MDFSLTEQQRMIQETAQGLFRKECDLDLIRKAWDDSEQASKIWHDHLSGWTELAAGDMTDVSLFIEEHGRALVPGPFYSTLLAHFIASAAGIELTAEAATVAISNSDGLWIPSNEHTKHFVPNAKEAKQIIVVNGSEQTPELSLLTQDQVLITEVDNMDRLRPIFKVEIKDTGDKKPFCPDAFKHAKHKALVTTAAELVGVGRNLLNSAVEYAKERQQFGRAIGSFQGLQWKLVNIAIELETAAGAVAYAAMAMDSHSDDTAQAVLCAKAEAGQAARHCARTSLQVHGGIGYTFEHGLHYALRRAYASDAFMGNHEYQFKQLGNLIF